MLYSFGLTVLRVYSAYGVVSTGVSNGICFDH